MTRYSDLQSDIQKMTRSTPLNQALSKTQQLGFDLVALFMQSILGTFWGTVDEKEKSHHDDDSKTPGFIDDNGGADGTRTRDLQRDRLAF